MASRKELAEQLSGVRLVLNTAQVVVSSLNLNEVLQNILHGAMSIMDMPAGTLALYDNDTCQLELSAHAGLSEQFVARGHWKVRQGGWAYEILEGGDPVILNDTSPVDFFNNTLTADEGIRSLIAVPLKIHHKTLGILFLDDFKPREFTSDQIALLSVLASFSSMSINHAQMHERVQRQACTDCQTGLYNHAQFKKAFAEEVARANRYGKSLSIILFAVDNFKQFNDTYGRPNGDIVLYELANMLRELLRDCDVVFRYGGDEFVTLLPETPLDEAIKVAERIRIFVETESPRFMTQITKTHGVTVSVGVAALPDDGVNTKSLLKIVDELMSKAKGKEKNKVYANSR